MMWKSVFLLVVFFSFASCYTVPCIGCYDYIVADVKDVKVIAAATEAVKLFSSLKASNYHYRLLEITDAQKSLCFLTHMCGKKAAYKMNVIISLTTCLKEEYDYKNIQQCPLRNMEGNLICKVETKANDKGEYIYIQTFCDM